MPTAVALTRLISGDVERAKERQMERVGERERERGESGEDIAERILLVVRHRICEKDAHRRKAVTYCVTEWGNCWTLTLFIHSFHFISGPWPISRKKHKRHKE